MVETQRNTYVNELLYKFQQPHTVIINAQWQGFEEYHLISLSRKHVFRT